MRRIVEYFKNNRSKRIFRKILLSYISMLAVFVISSIVLYHISSANLKNEIRRSSFLYLQKTQQEIEDHIGAVQSTMEKVYMDDVFQRCVWKDSREPLEMMDQYKLRKNLEKWKSQDILDLFVYSSKSGKIFAAVNASAQAELYFNTYYRNSSIEEGKTPYDSWEQAKKSGSSEVNYYESAVEGSTILLTMRYPAYLDNDSQAIIAVTLQPDIIKNALKGIQEGSLLIFNKDDQVIVKYGENIEDFILDREKGDYYVQKIDGDNYVIQTIYSELSGFTYVYAISERVFWIHMKEYLHMVVIFMAVFCGIGILMIWQLSRINYQPWNRLLATVQSSEVENGGVQQSEDQYIQAKFMEAVSQSQNYYDRLQQGKNTETDNTMFKYLRTGSDEERVRKILADADMIEKEDGYVLMEYHIETWNREQFPDLGATEAVRQIKGRLSAMFDSTGAGYIGKNMIIQLDRRTYLVLAMVSDKIITQNLSSLIYQTGNLLVKTCGIHNTTLLSELAGGIEMLPVLYQQIVDCAKYRYVFGKENLIRYSDICGREFSYKRNTEYIRNRILDWMKQKKENITEFDLINEIISNSMNEVKADAESIFLFQKDMTEVLDKIGKQLKFQNDMVWKEQMQILEGSGSWIEYKYYLSEIVKLLQATYQMQNVGKDIVEQVADYITTNYQNPDLNLNYLADLFHVSAQYLSRIFRSRYDTGILDYIAGVRITKAKEELYNSDATIETVAQDNGFTSSASFIRTFKKITGVTPGTYRENNNE